MGSIAIEITIKQQTIQYNAQLKESLCNESLKPSSDQVDHHATSERKQLYFN